MEYYLSFMHEQRGLIESNTSKVFRIVSISMILLKDSILSH